MRKTHALTALGCGLPLAGCQATTTYRPDCVHAVPPPATEQVDGKVLVYMNEADSRYVGTEGAETLTGSGLEISIPLGLMTQHAERLPRREDQSPRARGAG